MVKLKKIAAVPLARIFCVLNTVVGLLLGIIVAIGSASGQEQDGFWSLGLWSILVFPIVNAVLGFFTGVFLALTYNLFARWFGGIEFEVEEKRI